MLELQTGSSKLIGKVLGYFAISESLAAPSPELAERALWYGITLVIAGVAAFAMSWLAPDLSGIWCNSPRFLPRSRRQREEAELRREGDASDIG